MPKKQHVSFNYPLDIESDYIFPVRYYLNVKTGHSIIKQDQINLKKAIKVGIEGIVDNSEDENEEVMED